MSSGEHLEVRVRLRGPNIDRLRNADARLRQVETANMRRLVAAQSAPVATIGALWNLPSRQ